MPHKSRSRDLRNRRKCRKSRADSARRKIKQGKRSRKRDVDAMRREEFYMPVREAQFGPEPHWVPRWLR